MAKIITMTSGKGGVGKTTSSAAFGTGLWLSALNVKYRDVKYVVPFLTRIGMYATPVGFAITLVPEKWLFWFYTFNPLVGIVEGFRWCILGGNFEPLWAGVINGTAIMPSVKATAMPWRKARRT